jgi:4-hydroxy-tetrahydrodipicolinate synthase
MLDAQSLRGIIPPICTPLTEAGDIDRESLDRLVEYLIEGGVHGIFAFGSTGECTSLTSRQRDIMLKGVLSAVNGRVPVLVGVIDPSTERCIEQASAARSAGADGLVVAAPFYYRTTQAEVIEHFRHIHEAVDLPIMAYDIPVTVTIKLDSATIQQLYREGVIVGLKDSSGAVDALRNTLLRLRGTEFRAFTGSELVVDLCLRMGAHGSVPGVANVFPAEYVSLYNLAQAGRWDAAVQLQERLLLCFYDLIGQADSNSSVMTGAVGGFKSALKAKGILSSTRVAEPLRSFSPAQEQRVAEALRRHGFL